ncbi:MAG: hypothetical protein C0483_18440 [Pirellula sp.]|nr:hypothetical protein [Pirellula sp.]
MSTLQTLFDTVFDASAFQACSSDKERRAFRRRAESLIAGYMSSASVNTRAVRLVSMIDDLRADEGDSVEILCDNPEGPPNNAVRVSAGWTNYEFERFEGATLEAALTAACFAKAERSGK